VLEVKSLPHQNFAPVSVIIPCYQCALTIERAINSVVVQTLLPQEVLLIDDASQDDTWLVLENLAGRYPNWIKVTRLEQNRGAASTRNVGWSKATHPYIAFLDADDSWHPEKISIQFRFMHLHPQIGLSGHLYTWTERNSFPEFSPSVSKIKIISAATLMLTSQFPTPSVMIRSNINTRFAEGQRYSEDAFLWQKIALQGINIARIEISLVRLHKAPYGEGGLSADLWPMEIAELNNLINHYKEKSITLITLALLFSISLFKFTKRVAITYLRKFKYR
jgi:glycosyltransferase involved in cell wall biosynthesis